MRRRESQLRVKGAGLKTRFVLSMTAALTLVLAAAGYALHATATRIAHNVQTSTIGDAVRFTQEGRPYELDDRFSRLGNQVTVFPFRYPPDGRGLRYAYEPKDPALGAPFELFVPEGEDVGDALLKMIAVILVVVVLVGAGVALWVAGQVSAPVHELIDDVRQIAKGDLRHKTNAVGAGEIEVLARAIDRMTRDLEVAREAELELSIREREREVAAGVREALLPLATPLVEGYDVGAAFVGSLEFGGDFHDFIERGDGRVGLLVCDVSGSGIPAALIGATARAYLRTELERTDHVLESMHRVNRRLVDDVRRGMYVTALYAEIDPSKGRAQVVCAGHKMPLLRYRAADGKLRVIHPEGIALGFDRGPVFERRLVVEDALLEPGDRLVLTNSAPVSLVSPSGEELGERGLYARILKHASLDTPGFLKALRRDLDEYTGGLGIQKDVSLVTVARES